MYMGYGGEFFQAGSAAPAINNEKGIATLNTMKAMTEYMSPDYMTFNADEVKKNLQGGKTAMANGWGSLVSGLMDPKQTPPEIASGIVLAGAPTVGGGAIPAAALWWDGFAIAKNISDEDAEASFRAMVYGIRPEVGQEESRYRHMADQGLQAGSGRGRRAGQCYGRRQALPDAALHGPVAFGTRFGTRGIHAGPRRR